MTRLICFSVPDDGAEYVCVPKVATDELLHSMAVRYDHGLGVPGYYDNPLFAEAGFPSHEQRLQGTISQMRQLHEEVVGTGFYDAPPCRVVELPERNGVDFGWNACLDEIERRAK